MSPSQLATRPQQIRAVEAPDKAPDTVVPLKDALFDAPRNLSVNTYFRAMGVEHTPQYRFAPGTDFEQWRAEALPAVLATLGRMPQRVPPNAQVQPRTIEVV